MRIMLLNPAHPAIGSRVPREHLPPLGLLAVGGALVDAGEAKGLRNGVKQEVVTRACVGDDC